MRNKLALSILCLFTLALTTFAGDGAEPEVEGTERTDEPAEMVRISGRLVSEVVNKGETAVIAIVFDMLPHVHVYSPDDQFNPTKIEIALPDGISRGVETWPDFVKDDLGQMIFEGSQEVKIELAVADDFATDSVTLPIVVTYSACDDQLCHPPAETKFDLSFSFGADAAPATVSAVTTGRPSEMAESLAKPQSELPKGLLIMVLTAFVAGLGTLLTPCIYPMIPITLGFFATQSENRSQGKSFALAFAYALGIVAFYVILGASLSFVGDSLGALLNTDAAKWALAGIFVLFALSMFGLYDFRMPSFISDRFSGGGKAGGVGAFAMGMSLAVVGFACIGPFIGAAAISVLDSGDFVTGFATFSAFGVGQALPFLILGSSATLLKKIPRAGEWMDDLKHFFGFVFVLVAVYMLGLPILGNAYYLVFGFAVIATGTWFITMSSAKPSRVIWTAIGAMLLVFGGYNSLYGFALTGSGIAPKISTLGLGSAENAATVLVPSGDGFIEEKKTDLDFMHGWLAGLTFTEDYELGLKIAKEQNKPALIDYTTETCTNCRKMEQSVFASAEFRSRAKNFIIIVQDITGWSGPDYDRLLAKYKTVATPTYLLFSPSANEPSHKLGYVPQEEFIAAMDSLTE
ncbi:MAG: sulfite exporter TauE/SafE family protein [Planctomycetes bacterium]|nr:sulfite exporter TauE/SafE family protein [Planctomycetota bacterium]